MSPPSPPALPSPATSDPRDAAFTSEPREAAWAAPTERELRARFQAVRGGKLADLECRTRQCRAVITGNEAELGHTIAELSGSHGLHGYADKVVLAAPDARPDGSFALRAFIQFRR